MDLLNEVTVTLVVKAPNQKVADQTVECALGWTVRKLKEHLARVYPSNPTENQQKIIYSGKLLQDDITLKDVLRQNGQSETVHTVHLVCCSSSPDGSTSQSASNLICNTVPVNSEGIRQRRPVTSETPQQDAIQQPQVSDQSSTERLQFSPSAFHPTHYNPFMSSYLPPGAVAMSTPPAANGSYSMEQLMWLQQQAYMQYLTNYMQFFQQGTIPVGQPYIQSIPPFTLPPNPANQEAAIDQPLNAAGHRDQPQQPPIVRMNAQGGPVNEDDDDMDRDWLDWFYVGVRFALLMCILYFYSTPTRFFVTLLLMLFVYFFQVGWFRVIVRLRREVPDANPAPPANADGQPNGGTQDDPVEAGPEEQRQPGGFALAWSVFLAFFTSLAPQPPPPVNAN